VVHAGKAGVFLTSRGGEDLARTESEVRAKEKLLPDQARVVRVAWKLGAVPEPPEQEEVLENMKETLYQAKTEIDEEAGSLRCDCSGFIGCVLSNYFPEAYLSLRGTESPWRTRPYSVTYYETFVSSGDEGSGTGGWRRISRMMLSIRCQ
jgi:hypothetical protein